MEIKNFIIKKAHKKVFATECDALWLTLTMLIQIDHASGFRNEKRRFSGRTWVYEYEMENDNFTVLFGVGFFHVIVLADG